MNKTFDLPISKNYIDNWGITEALRELRANAEDGAQDGEFGIEYNRDNQEVVIWNKSTEKLTPSSLVLGASTKTAGDKNIGQFGEGYKLALVVMLRENKRVAIHNLDEIWSPSFQDSEQYGTETLHVQVEKNPGENETVMFSIYGITAEEFDYFESTLLSTYVDELDFLLEVEGVARIYETISLCEKKAALNAYTEEWHEARQKLQKAESVFVGGQRVESGECRFAIDFFPSAVKLNRDRDSIENGYSLTSKMIGRALLASEQKLSSADITRLDEDFLEELSNAEKKELRTEVLAVLGLPADTTKLYAHIRSDIEEEAKKLGIKLEKTTVYLDWPTQHIYKTLGVEVEDFEHPILTTSVAQIMASFEEEHREVLMAKGNEKMLSDVKILVEVSKELYREL